MSEIYAEAAAEALALLEEFGATITIERTTAQVIDPVTFAETSPGTSGDYTCNAVLRPFPSSLIDGTQIQTGDRELIMDATTEPKMADVPVVSGRNWSIQNIVAINPAGTPIIYRVQVRS